MWHLIRFVLLGYQGAKEMFLSPWDHLEQQGHLKRKEWVKSSSIVEIGD